jgi:E3 ubiquitin-protein ligase HERC1
MDWMLSVQNEIHLIFKPFSGKRLSCEVVLALASQRGSLRYLLEWIEMALFAAAASKVDKTSTEGEKPRMLMHTYIMSIVLVNNMD